MRRSLGAGFESRKHPVPEVSPKHFSGNQVSESGERIGMALPELQLRDDQRESPEVVGSH